MERAESVFRPEAVRRYQDSREKTVLPLFGRPQVRPVGWIVLGLLLAVMGVAALAEVPVYVRGVAIPVGAPDAEGVVTSVAIFPPESLPRLKVGQRAFVELSEGGGIGVGTVTDPSPRLLSPDELDAQLQTPVRVTTPTKPVAVASARFAWAEATNSSRAVRSPRALWVEVGSRRLGSLLTPR